MTGKKKGAVNGLMSQLDDIVQKAGLHLKPQVKPVLKPLESRSNPGRLYLKPLRKPVTRKSLPQRWAEWSAYPGSRMPCISRTRADAGA